MHNSNNLFRYSTASMKDRNFCQKWNFFVENRNFCQIPKFWSKIEIFVENRFFLSKI